MKSPGIALITGANRGIGFEVAKQLINQGFKVILTARKEEDALKAAECLRMANKHNEGDVVGMGLDVCSAESILAAQKKLSNRFVGVLVNNAGVFLDDPRVSSSIDIFNLPVEDLFKTLDVNLIGALRMIQAFIPSMLKIGYGRIVNVASGMGRDVELDTNAPYYRLSKSGLITLTRLCALSISKANVKINAVCPGWVRTRMGGAGAVRSVEEGAKGVVLAALIPPEGPSGQLLRDGKIFDWMEPKNALSQPKEKT